MFRMNWITCHACKAHWPTMKTSVIVVLWYQIHILRFGVIYYRFVMVVLLTPFNVIWPMAVKNPYDFIIAKDTVLKNMAGKCAGICNVINRAAKNTAMRQCFYSGMCLMCVRVLVVICLGGLCMCARWLCVWMVISESGPVYAPVLTGWRLHKYYYPG